MAVVGAGPTGLFTAMALARRGHRVTVVDRDTGPRPDGAWPRRGVMQFHHPHALRAQVAEALQTELPDVWDELLAAGAEPVAADPAAAGGSGALMAVRCRRSTFERVLREAALRQPGLVLHTGHADEVRTRRGRATGVRTDGTSLDADVVIAATGRAGRLGQDRRAPARGGDCGIAYVSRQYRLRPGAPPGPMNFPLGRVDVYPGYQAIVFLHDNGIFSTVIARSSDDRALADLRLTGVFEAAAAAVPALAAWTDPDRAQPVTPVLPGGRLRNTYQGQLDDAGAVALPGLVFVGDAVCTTNPAVGRGIATSLLQARELLRLLDDDPHDLAGLTLAFDAWCSTMIAPWFEDHLYWDAELIRRWAGADVDLTRPLPSDLVVAAAQADPALFPLVGPYLGMRALPASLDAARARAAEIYASGWRPPTPPGPTRDELAALAAAHATS
ncbi:FAD-dependent oxidoreductase [Pseudonocardia kujensis]|uniref:FAD-dependent oxidoreductase n=1 Tax=Pseudonocardia kujensis TaxID=1128675 RepID=UPI001E31CD85|nr:FAD-dependent oxidoreductase [Pseudonocardia kujensis]MCE0763018.1 FAD-dependent oxidoreductase [Pseudonocardia kujensis]